MEEMLDFNHLRIEPAKREDIPLLIKIATEAYEHLSYQYLQKKLGPPGYNFLQGHYDWLNYDDYSKIVYKNNIIGGLILQNYKGTLFLGMIFITIPYQHQGIGTYVLKYIEKNTLAKRIILNTPEWAIQNQFFFEKNGFSKIDEEFSSDLGFTLFFYQKNKEEEI